MSADGGPTQDVNPLVGPPHAASGPEGSQARECSANDRSSLLSLPVGPFRAGNLAARAPAVPSSGSWWFSGSARAEPGTEEALLAAHRDWR
jgi:hypothetical protein